MGSSRGSLCTRNHFWPRNYIDFLIERPCKDFLLYLQPEIPSSSLKQSLSCGACKRQARENLGSRGTVVPILVQSFAAQGLTVTTLERDAGKLFLLKN